MPPTAANDARLSKLIAIAQLRQSLVRAYQRASILSNSEPDRAQYAKLQTIYTLAATATNLLNEYGEQAMRE